MLNFINSISSSNLLTAFAFHGSPSDDPVDEIARGPSPHRISSPPPLIIEQNPQVSQDRAQSNEDPIQQVTF